MRICWLTAPGVTDSSSAARVMFRRLAAASNALSAFSGGMRLSCADGVLRRVISAHPLGRGQVSSGQEGRVIDLAAVALARVAQHRHDGAAGAKIAGQS